MKSTRRRYCVSIAALGLSAFAGCTFPVPGSGEYRTLGFDGFDEQSVGDGSTNFSIEPTVSASGKSTDWETFHHVRVVGFVSDEELCSHTIGDISPHDDVEITLQCPRRPDAIEFRAQESPCDEDTTIRKVVYVGESNDDVRWNTTDVSCEK